MVDKQKREQARPEHVAAYFSQFWVCAYGIKNQADERNQKRKQNNHILSFVAKFRRFEFKVFWSMLSGAMKKLLFFVLLFSSFAVAKPREWQDGIVYGMASSNQGAAAAPVGNIMLAIPLTRLHYFIETSDLKIETFFPGGKPLNVTMNKKTKIAIDGDKLYLIDDSGKEKKLHIIQKRAKPEAASPPA